MTEKISYIPARLKSAVKGGFVTGASDVYDDNLGRNQHEINSQMVNLNSRVSTLEQHESIVLEGGEIGIGSVEDFEQRTEEGDAKVPTVGAVADFTGMKEVQGQRFLKVVTDNADRILYAVTAEGDFVWGIGVPTSIKEYIAAEQLMKVDKEQDKSLIPIQYIEELEHPEFIRVLTDKDGRILLAVKKNGDVLMGFGVPEQVKEYVESITEGLEARLENIMYTMSDAYDYLTNEPLLPNEIYVLDNQPTILYRRSMVLDPDKVSGMDMVLTSKPDNLYHRSIDVGNPVNLNYSDLGDSARITVEKPTAPTKNVYKDITVHKATVASKTGHTPKILMIGDSITQGRAGSQWSSPIVAVYNLLQSRYGITPTMIGTFMRYDVAYGEGRGCFNFEAMAGLENNPFAGQYHFPSVGGTLESSDDKTTTQFQNPFTFPATAEDLVAHPDWCFTNSNNYPEETDGVSYADATEEQRSGWHFFIFDFERYINLWGDNNHVPDIITIALGTNDWWPDYQIHMEKTLKAIDIIYTRIREAAPDARIVFVTANNIAITFQDDSKGNWVSEISRLLLNIQHKVAGWKEDGDDNVYELPIYAQGSRWLAFDGDTAGEPSDLSDNNNVQVQDIDANVHLLYGVGTDGYWEYMHSLLTCVTVLS